MSKNQDQLQSLIATFQRVLYFLREFSILDHYLLAKMLKKRMKKISFQLILQSSS